MEANTTIEIPTHSSPPTSLDERSTSVSDGQQKIAKVNERDPTVFSVIWHNLTYKVNSARWYTRAKERFFNQSNSELNIEVGSIRGSTEQQRHSYEKTILNQVCGDAKSRQLTAIMGPSGAGKSTLLHCLFQNRTAGTSGKILVEGHSRKRLKVCFIPQKDYLNEWLTVREDLIFVSKLKLARMNTLVRDDSDANIKEKQDLDENNSYVRQRGKDCRTSLIDHEANALHVAELLGLNNCLDVTIKNISGGQRKRLSIARELMSKPDILVLDEPTTGLDSLACYKTIMVLRDLAHFSSHPMLVIVTIHQPEKSVYNMFDKTYFLSKSGHSIYDDSPKNAIETIENIAKVKLPVPNYNPATLLIELASDNSKSGVIDQLSAYQKSKFSEKYDLSHIKRLMRSNQDYMSPQNWKLCAMENDNSIYSASSGNDLPLGHIQLSSGASHFQDPTFQPATDTLVKEVDSNALSEIDLGEDGSYFISRQLKDCLSSHSNNLLQSFRHVFILTHRSWLSIIRNPSLTKTKLAFHISLPFLMLLVFGDKMGVPNVCPSLETELDIKEMTKSIDNGLVAKNVDEIRLAAENISFFFILMYGFGINIISCTASFYPLTMHMYKKETINGLYSAAPYFIGQMLAELPLEMLFPTISILLSYPLSGQLSSFLEWRMFAVAFYLFIFSYSVHGIGLLCGSIFVNDVSVAVILGQISLLPMVMFSGFLIRPCNMPGWMEKFSRITNFRLGLSGVIAARYGFNACECDEDMIPEGGKIELAGMNPRVKHVIEYMFPIGNSSDPNSSDDIDVTKLFDKMGQQFVKAQTFGLEIDSCEDVRPHVMHIFGVDDSDLYYSAIILLVITVVIKLTTFSLVKSFPYRIS